MDDRERRTLEARRRTDCPVTLQELGTEFGLTGERVRQIESRASAKVQDALAQQAARGRAVRLKVTP
ncbi:sigma factor-like helix-turn-helix DNA-binding protein [Tianweitania sediminis]|uniref:RNA polymerase sigma-70 region 4 domain-containing protein n=1 Tax=Tianweitania sediminis TaxID=1502156 RepID=A0A8J7RRG2_9HYPH|nr:sigma factor-like helix-turn-helix DNA-binding protein [Tianweitania sediminis]MBP0440709.1 hypothetical protein [Tianweitania sediminis]